jgi:RsiW-degrading membrane proteinase PrsW (M82 family)
MSIGGLVLPILLPVAFWACYHYYKDRHLPEPISHLLLAFVLGVGSYYLGILMYRALGLVGLRFDAYELAATNLPGLFAYAVLAIGMIEESVKLAPFLLVIIHFNEFDEYLDGIIYASFIALGFSAVENFYYLPYLTGPEALGRGFAGPVVHIVFASIWGFYIGRAQLRQRFLGRTIVIALAGTAVLHGTYDFAVIAMPATILPATAVLIIAIWLWRLRLIRHLHTLSAGHRPPGADDI